MHQYNNHGSRKDSTNNMTEAIKDQYKPYLLLVDNQRNGTTELCDTLQENGMEIGITLSAQEALAVLQQKFCDALLLEVPTIDIPASQVVTIVRNRFPFLPIVILSSHRNMNDAIGALNAGAIHLISIPYDTRQIMSALRKILAVHKDTLTPLQIFPGLQQTIRFQLPSSLDYITGAANHLVELLLRFGIMSFDEINVKVAIVEALMNAVEHGHKLNPNLNVKVEVEIDEQKSVIKISDEGKGFNHKHLPDPTAPENLYRPRGRGIYMMYRLMDEVNFNRRGNSVRLVKYKRYSEISQN